MTRYQQLVICIELAQCCSEMGDSDAKHRIAAYRTWLRGMVRS